MSTLISTSEAANLLKVSPQSVCTLCRDGTIDATKIGKSWVINQASLNKYILHSKHKVAEDHPAYNVNKKE